MNKRELDSIRAWTKKAVVLVLVSLTLVLACDVQGLVDIPVVPPATSTAVSRPAIAPPTDTPTPVPAPSSKPTLLPGGVAVFRSSLPDPTQEVPTQQVPIIAPSIILTQDAKPVPTPAGFPESSLDALVIAATPADVPGYNRRQWRHWVDADGDCQDARQEVLVEESVGIIIFTDVGQCRVASGQWVAPFTGTVVTDPSKLDIDHLVPLANAHWSGGHAWDADRKRAYANDLSNPGHLVAVTASANRSKGARGPEDWKPPDESYWCQYATDWVEVKLEWELTVTPAEFEALREMLELCR